MSLNEFPPEVANELKHYVYRLIDPRNDETFYVGKGQGNRVFAHVNDELKSNAEDDSDEGIDYKLQRIRDIKNSGHDVEHVIHRHGMDDKETAFAVESALMAAYPGLLNKAGGHGSNEYGCMHAKEVIDLYKARETDIKKHKVLIIKINRSASETDSIHEIYEAVRASWRLRGKAEKAKEAEYVLAVLNGLVIGVFVPEEWEEYPSNDGRPGRWGFVGEKAPSDIWDFYIGTRLPDSMRKKGAAAPVRYAY